MSEHAIQSIIEMSLAIGGTIALVALTGHFVFKWLRFRAELHQRQDISDELSRAIQDEFTRLHRQNADLQYRINKIEQKLEHHAPADEVAKQQQAQQLST